MHLRHWVAGVRRRALLAFAVPVALLTVVSVSLSGAIDLDALATAAGRPPFGRPQLQQIQFEEPLVLAWQWGRADTGGDERWSPAPLNSPVDVAVDDHGDVYVADDSKVQKFNSRGELVAVLGNIPAPLAIAVGRSEVVYVTRASMVLRYDPQGSPHWSRFVPDATMTSPMGVATDPNGNVYVADVGGKDVVKFNAAGDLISRFKLHADHLPAPDRILLSVGPSGNMYVLIGGDHPVYSYVQTYDPNGRLLAAWDRNFYWTRDITTDAKERVYLSRDYPLLLYTREGEFITWSLEVSYGHGVAVAASGDIYVAERYLDRVRKFRFGYPDRRYAEPDFEALSAKASSGLPVTYRAEGTCEIRRGTRFEFGGTRVHLTGPGRCTVIASQSGNSRYAPARASRSFDIHAAGN